MIPTLLALLASLDIRRFYCSVLVPVKSTFHCQYLCYCLNSCRSLWPLLSYGLKTSQSQVIIMLKKTISGHILMYYLQVILAQEKNIQQLNELIQSLQLQLLHCRGSNSTAHTTSSQSTRNKELEGQEMIGD